MVQLAIVRQALDRDGKTRLRQGRGYTVLRRADFIRVLGLESLWTLREPWLMKLPGREARPHAVLSSELGFLEMAGRDLGLLLPDAFVRFRDLVSADMEWTDSRKIRFRKRASYVKIAALLLTGSSTVVLGIQAIPSRADIALPMVALVTVFGALEAFFNWRSRWVLMEEAQYRLNRIRDEMDYYLVTTPPAELEKDRLNRFFAEQQDVWNDVSRRWVEFRKLGSSPEGDQAITKATYSHGRRHPG